MDNYIIRNIQKSKKVWGCVDMCVNCVNNGYRYRYACVKTVSRLTLTVSKSTPFGGG